MEKEIKKITINFEYSCWGQAFTFKREIMSFSKNNFMFTRTSADTPTIYNPCVTMSYDIDVPYYDSFFLKDRYKENFASLCVLVELLKEGNCHVCDAMPASIEIEYSDGSKRVANDLPSTDENEEAAFNQIMRIASTYKPKLYVKNPEDIF